MKRLTISIVGLALAASALAQQFTQTRNPLDPSLCMTASKGSIFWRTCVDGDPAQVFPTSSVAAPAPAPSTPAPAPSTPTEPPKTTTPAEVSTAPIALESTVSGPPGAYPYEMVNGQACLNNNWGAKGTLATGKQSLGSRPSANGGVDLRAVFAFPGDKTKEVASYPSCAAGQTPSGSPAGSAFRPIRQVDIIEATAGYATQSGSMTYGQATWDIWYTSTANCRGPACRRIELMVPTWPHGGYAAPAPWDGPSAAGRKPEDLGTGPNKAGYVGRETIGGVLYDVYNYPQGQFGRTDPWRLVALRPVVYPRGKAFTLDVKAAGAFMVRKGWLSPTEYLAAIEYGWEPVVSKGPITGDVSVFGLTAKVR